MLLYARINHNNGVAADAIGAATHIIEDGSMRADHKYKDIDNDEINYFRIMRGRLEHSSR